MKYVCYIVPITGLCGGLIVILEHVNRLKKRGFDVCLLHIRPGNTIDWFPGNIVPVYSVFEDKDTYPKEVDILVATGWETAYYPYVLPITAKRYAYFVQSDERRFFPENTLEPELAELTYTLPYEYITEAKWIKKMLHDEFGHDALLVPNALNETVIHKTEPLKPKTETLRVLLEGPIALPIKGMDDAFRAVEGLDVEIWCVSSVGRPKEGQHCDCFFEGVPFNKMRDIYSSCDVLLKMSKVEGFFGPPLEMMACGGTAVTTRVTGYDEYIVDEENALTVEIGDWQGARKQLQRLIDDRNLLERLKEGAQETARKMRWDTSIDILAKDFSKNKGNAFSFSSEREEKAFKTVSSIVDHALVLRDETYDGKKTLLAIAERDARIAERDGRIAERDARIAERDAHITERDAHIAEQNKELQSRTYRMVSRLRENSVLRVFYGGIRRVFDFFKGKKNNRQ